MLSQKIRDDFIHYFKNKGHTHLPSSPVVPYDDPTLLFINAGMNQFKDIFLGKLPPSQLRAVTSQKCIRVGGKHNDLENVGHTTRHLTFFEMMGNFSFGDYFKKEAIDFSFDFFCKVLKLDVNKLWATVFHEDNESFDLWKRHLPEERICRMGEVDNFWSMGQTGPCGPCSELLYDRGSTFSNARTPAEDVEGERFFEFWNLVFMEFNRDLSGKLDPLPKKCVDTGAGLERLVALKMNETTLFDTDVLRALIGHIETLSGKKYDPTNMQAAAPFRVIADHMRSLVFAICDGVEPSNVERGYVLRKVLRRATRYGRMLGLDRPFLGELVPPLIEMMGASYPELAKSKERTLEILFREEENFLRTLKRGGGLLTQVMAASEKSGKQISGEDAFKLKDTYGFPLEEIVLLAKDADLSVDLARFEELEHEARLRSKKAHKKTHQIAAQSDFASFVETKGAVEFIGFEQLTAEATIIGLMKDQHEVDALYEGDEGFVLLDQTPFYAEMGGQVGDQGVLSTNGSEFRVVDCQSPYPEVQLHKGSVTKGSLKMGDQICATVDRARRTGIQNNHTATHLLHWALERILGEHIKQAGSVVEAGRLRFDFSHHKPLSDQEIIQIEDLINEKIREDQLVTTYEMAFSEVQNQGEIKQFFGEKYGDRVRVVDIEFSKELCGGTHTSRLGTLGLFRITKESSIAAGIRRIEAVTGAEAVALGRKSEQEIAACAALLKVPPHRLTEKLDQLLQEHRGLEKKLSQYKKEGLKSQVDTLMQQVEHAGEIDFLFGRAPIEAAEAKEFADLVMQKKGSLLLLLVVQEKERCQLVARASADYIKQGIRASDLIKEVAPIIGARGGGRPDAAQAGGGGADNLEKMLKQAGEWIRKIGKTNS